MMMPRVAPLLSAFVVTAVMTACSSTESPPPPPASTGGSTAATGGTGGDGTGGTGNSTGTGGDAGGGTGGDAGTTGTGGSAGSPGTGGGAGSPGTGGSAGASGAAGAGSGGGPARMCTLSTDIDSCDSCIRMFCNNPCIKCEDNASCVSILGCIKSSCISQGAVDGQCASNCIQAEPNGSTDFNAVAGPGGCANGFCAGFCSIF